ncbi:MAG: hypothetical protein QOF89_4282 [Acidobacteriota bacterium]|jgi:hypothetical protein|nr:hypothetical protein [Acidobacteriota bacterium]
MRRFGTVLALGFLLAGDVHAAPPVQRVDARQLVRTTLGALDGIAQAARVGLDPKNPRQAPFLAALTQFQARVQTIEAALARPGEELFGSLDLGSSDLGALRVAWARAGVSSPRMAEGIRIASDSYRMLRANYGREGLRHRQGGGLSAAEARQFRRVRQAQQRFAASLRALRNEASHRGDRTTTAELDRFRAEAERIAWAPLDLESYLNALIVAGELRGEWAADRPYVRKAAAPRKLAAADQAVEDLYVDSDIGQVFAVNLGSESEVPNGEGDAVQVYQTDRTDPTDPTDPSDLSGGEAEPVAPVETGGAVSAAATEDDEEGPIEAEAMEPVAADDSAADAAEEAPAVDPADPAAAAKKPDAAEALPPADPPKPPPIG